MPYWRDNAKTLRTAPTVLDRPPVPEVPITMASKCTECEHALEDHATMGRCVVDGCRCTGWTRSVRTR